MNNSNTSDTIRLDNLTIGYKTHDGIRTVAKDINASIKSGKLTCLVGTNGIGKSTLMLQICSKLCEMSKVLYVSGEESEHQLKLRAKRLRVENSNLYVISETCLGDLMESVAAEQPDILIVDSIQTLYNEELDSPAGSVSQVKDCTMTLMQLAKGQGITVFVIGHVNKEGSIAGPKVLEHMVDCVLYFEGDQHMTYRILRAAKNRFGATNEIGVFEMRGNGLVEVPNPSEYMLAGKPKQAPGSIVVCSIEGTRPILIEVQALVCQTNFNMPRRTSTGTDYNRVNLLMAVIEKRMGVRMGDCDAYINVAGGMRIHEPALDLGIILALLTSYRNQSLDDETICFGEVGLAGEVRAVNMAEQRVLEAAKLGFKRCILPKVNCRQLALTKEQTRGLELVGIESIHELLEVF